MPASSVKSLAASKRDAIIPLSRRCFLRGGSLFLGNSLISQTRLFADEKGLGSENGLGSSDKTASDDKRVLKVGMMTDLHYAEKSASGSRHYRESVTKLTEAAKQFSNDRPDFIVELGDLVDRADSVETELRYLKTINAEFAAICEDRHYVLGNHCVDTLRKEEFLETVERPKSFYSFDRGDFHFIVLDSCFRSDSEPYGRKNFKWTDANVPQSELEWLQSDLESNQRRTIVFAHQRIDETKSHSVKNNAAVRQVLESTGNVLAVFQGHSHRNDVSEINGIHYCTLVAMVEGSGTQNNAYSVMTIAPSGDIIVDGFRKQSDYRW